MKNIKKHFDFGITVMFLILTISPSINADLLQSEPDETCNEIALFRVDSNGQIMPVDVCITSVEGQDLETTIAEKCKELCENDKELQQTIRNVDESSKWIEVESKGRGFHWSFRRIIFSNRNVLWRLVIKYRYFFGDGYTKIRMNESDEWTTLVEGPHFVRIIGFTGYVNFKPRIFWGSTIIHGYALGIDWGTPRWPKQNY